MNSRLKSHPHGSPLPCALVLLALALGVGCGQLKSYTATEQLLLSNAVDEAVQKLDFTPLAGKKVFVDTSFVRDGKQYGCVHDGYMISSVRQQMMADGCLLFDKREEAEVIVEARVGTLGADAHEITYGLPASNALSSAATVMGSAAPIPAIPEISLAKRTQNDGAAKLALFAFDAKTRAPLWQSGVSLAKTTSANTWLLGAGPWPKNNKAKKTSRWNLFRRAEAKESEEEPETKNVKSSSASTTGKVAFDEAHIFPALQKSTLEHAGEMIAQTPSSTLPSAAKVRLKDDEPVTQASAHEAIPVEQAVAAATEKAAEKLDGKLSEKPMEKPNEKSVEPAKHALASSAALGE